MRDAAADRCSLVPDVAVELANEIKPTPPASTALSRAYPGENLPAPKSETVRSIVSEARESGEAVDEVIEAEAVGLWEATSGALPHPGSAAKVVRSSKGTRELSVLEKRYLAEARERQRENIFSSQVAGGKTWVGPAFLCKPEVLEFRDFIVGETYKLRFSLTNVSYSFNSFKPLPLADAYR